MSKIIENTTCFLEHEKLKIPCSKKSCRQWINCSSKLNCAVHASKEGPRTLQAIGELHGLTRMRICQIEKAALKKIKEFYFNSQQ